MKTKKKTARRAAPKRRAQRSKRTAAPRRKAASARMTTRKAVGAPARRRRIPEVGGMTVREAGRMGGLIGGKKGGETVKRERGVEFFQEIGRKGGQRVRDLIAAGRRATEKPTRRRHT